MYNEDYFKKVLGSNYDTNDLYNNSTYDNNHKHNIISDINQNNDNRLESETDNTNEHKSKLKEFVSNFERDFTKYYPEIFNIVEPIVEAVLNKNSEVEVSAELIETMAREVYDAVEDDGRINNNESNNVNHSNTTAIQVSTKPKPKNKLLYDLIKILLLNHIKPHNKPIPKPDHNDLKPDNRPPHSKQTRLTYDQVPFPEELKL